MQELILLAYLFVIWLAFTILVLFGNLRPPKNCPQCFCQLCFTLFFTPILLAQSNWVAKELLLFIFGMGVMGYAILFYEWRKESNAQNGVKERYVKEKIALGLMLAAIIVFKILGVY